VRRIFHQIANAPLDLPRFLIFGHAIQHSLISRLDANVDPLAACVTHPLDEFWFEQLHPHLPTPG
jgi:hypothetical protein